MGSHGTAMSTIINHYDKSFGYEDFDRISGLMPWVAAFTFSGRECVDIQKIDLFQSNTGK